MVYIKIMEKLEQNWGKFGAPTLPQTKDVPSPTVQKRKSIRRLSCQSSCLRFWTIWDGIWLRIFILGLQILKLFLNNIMRRSNILIGTLDILHLKPQFHIVLTKLIDQINIFFIILCQLSNIFFKLSTVFWRLGVEFLASFSICLVDLNSIGFVS